LAFCLGLPFLWKALKARWNEALASFACWLVVLYPESVLVGAGLMREPFLLGLAMIALWAVFSWRSQHICSLVIFCAASVGMLAFSLWTAVVMISAFIVLGWFENMEEIAHPRSKWLNRAILIVAISILLVSIGSWFRSGTLSDAERLTHTPSAVNYLLKYWGQELRTPFEMTYGLFQPVASDILAETAPVIWKAIELSRVAGWYILAPFFLLAVFSSLSSLAEKDRRPQAWMAISALLWIVICSAAFAGDTWDNPRSRVLFLPFIAVLTAWVWKWNRVPKEIRRWGWVGTFFAVDALILSCFAAILHWENLT
jgi:hypothetical protein